LAHPVDDLLASILGSLDLPPRPQVEVTGSDALRSVFRVGDLAVAAIAAAGCSIATLVGHDEPITVDRQLAAQWFGLSIRPGWTLPPAWDALAGDYRAADGWIRLHTNASHHRAAALRVLGVPDDRSAVEAAVAGWRAEELQDAVAEAAGAAAAMRSIDEWRRHPQGIAVGAEPLVGYEPGTRLPNDSARASVVDPERPLAGVRVLDLTRVLAGPIATRLLAGWGADVLRIDPPGWDEPGVIPEVMLGKRTARLDLTLQRDRFLELLAAADVLVHGYRADALERLGLGQAERDAIRPGLVDVALNAYGWTGPWRNRRGFDSLVQMSSGIAAEGMRRFGADRPTPLPVQALDHATGYLMAAAAIRGLLTAQREGYGSRWRLSLARTAALLVDAGRRDAGAPSAEMEPPLTDDIEHTSWGPARRVRPPLTVPAVPLRWTIPARALGSDEPVWDQRRP
jgi:crotonobetainyl-CoA:carnitine CoA-transferase CaiB-like acyl-CoA transferase